MKIRHLDILEIGQYVKVKERLGVVVSAEREQAHPSGMITVHTIRFSHRTKLVDVNRYRYVPLEKEQERTERVNYSFIEPVSKEWVGEDICRIRRRENDGTTIS